MVTLNFGIKHHKQPRSSYQSFPHQNLIKQFLQNISSYFDAAIIKMYEELQIQNDHSRVSAAKFLHIRTAI